MYGRQAGGNTAGEVTGTSTTAPDPSRTEAETGGRARRRKRTTQPASTPSTTASTAGTYGQVAPNQSGYTNNSSSEGAVQYSAVNNQPLQQRPQQQEEGRQRRSYPPNDGVDRNMTAGQNRCESRLPPTGPTGSVAGGTQGARAGIGAGRYGQTTGAAQRVPNTATVPQDPQQRQGQDPQQRQGQDPQQRQGQDPQQRQGQDPQQTGQGQPRQRRYQRNRQVTRWVNLLTLVLLKPSYISSPWS